MPQKYLQDLQESTSQGTGPTKGTDCAGRQEFVFNTVL